MNTVADQIALHLYRFAQRAETEQEAVCGIAEACYEKSWELPELYRKAAPPAMPLPPTEDTPF